MKKIINKNCNIIYMKVGKSKMALSNRRYKKNSVKLRIRKKNQKYLSEPFKSLKLTTEV